MIIATPAGRPLIAADAEIRIRLGLARRHLDAFSPGGVDPDPRFVSSPARNRECAANGEVARIVVIEEICVTVR